MSDKTTIPSPFVPEGVSPLAHVRELLAFIDDAVAAGVLNAEEVGETPAISAAREAAKEVQP